MIHQLIIQGITWEEDIRLTNSPRTSISPSIAAVDSNVHVVWMDVLDGNEETFYKRNPTGIRYPVIQHPASVHSLNFTFHFITSSVHSLAMFWPDK